MPGDGIGPEITKATRGALEVLSARFALGLKFEQRDIGLASLAAQGSTLPQDVLQRCHSAHGILLAPVSSYDYPPPAQGGINPSAKIRKELDLYANIRPSRATPGVPCASPNMDLVLVRENTEGFYADRNMHSGSGEFQPTKDVALAMRKITRSGSTRIAQSAFELAMTRRRHVTAVHKANVLSVTDGLFLECVNEVATRYNDVTLETRIVDAMAAELVTAGERFDVVVTTNMYGDILSDEAAALAGGLGQAGALNTGAHHGVAQATHGSAPDIAGKGIANPTALLRSAAMLLQWLGAKHNRDDLLKASVALQSALEIILNDPTNHTPDLGGTATTESFSHTLCAEIEK